MDIRGPVSKEYSEDRLPSFRCRNIVLNCHLYAKRLLAYKARTCRFRQQFIDDSTFKLFQNTIFLIHIPEKIFLFIFRDIGGPIAKKYS